MARDRQRHLLYAAAGFLAVCCTGAVLSAGAAGADAVPATVTVDAQTELATVPAGASGVNAPAWNPHLMDDVTLDRLREANVRTLVWQVGPATDLYRWYDNGRYPDPEPVGRPWPISLNGPELAPKYTFDDFAQRAQAIGAKMVVHVNYGTGTPAEAADWVAYAKTRGYHVERWVIGEEQFINGYLGTPKYMPDGHADKSPTAYATNALAFIDAMKAADPDAQVGIGLAPATPVGSPFWNWNETVMAIAGRAVDFVDYHYYTGGGGTDAALLASPARVPATIARLRDLLDRTQGPSHRVDLVVGEANSNAFAGPQQVRPANALFLADFGATLLDQGVAGFEWYSLHDRAVGDGSSWIGDLGMLSSGECVGAICEPPAGTPFPPFHGLRVLNAVMKPHDTIVQASSSDALVSAHAVTRNGKLTVLLVNKSPDTTFLAQLQTPGFDARSYRVIAYYDATGAVEPGHGAPTCAGQALSLAPYSISAVQMSSHSDGCGS